MCVSQACPVCGDLTFGLLTNRHHLFPFPFWWWWWCYDYIFRGVLRWALMILELYRL